MRLELYHHFEEDGEVLRIVKKLLANQEKIMATLDDILEDVKAEGTMVDSLEALINGLKDQVAQALQGATLPAGTQEKIDAIFNMTEANKARMAQALQTAPTTPAGSGPPA